MRRQDSEPLGGWTSETSSWWQREFTDGVDPEYTDQILPLVLAELASCERIVDVGTGEGQVARALAAQGADVIGVDPIPAQIDEAKKRGGGPSYLLCPADSLALRDNSVDGAVACLVFEHIDELEGALAEVKRVVKPGGLFLLLLNHPLLQTPGSGWIDDQWLDPPEQYWRIGPYLTEGATVDEVQKDVFIRFVHRPLSRYLNAAFEVGLVLERMHEPAPPEAFLAKGPQFRLASSVPRLLGLRFRA